jgi:hypothetical protein
MPDDTTTAAPAPEMARVCLHCEARAHALDMCDACELCPSCCECVRCDQCEELHREPLCRCCNACDNCCECDWCRACEEPVESTCAECDACEDCCRCWYCHGCNERHHEDTDQCGDCENCQDQCRCHPDGIEPYDTDPLESLAFLGTPAGDLYLGAELEVQVRGDLEAKAADWNSASDGFFILKEDGSIGKGFEIVTAPASLAVHTAQWDRLLGDADLVHGLRSWDADRSCGMHVHASRAPLSPLTLGKVLVFMNSPHTAVPLRRLAGRDSERWAKREPKKLTHALAHCRRCQTPRKTSGVGYCRQCQERTDARAEVGARRQVVNLCNSDTVEFRLFRGTLNLTHVLANLECVDAVLRWCMHNSIRDCESWPAFWAYVARHSATYKHLIAYMQGKEEE